MPKTQLINLIIRNPYFIKDSANRMKGRAMGRGFVTTHQKLSRISKSSQNMAVAECYGEHL